MIAALLLLMMAAVLALVVFRSPLALAAVLFLLSLLLAVASLTAIQGAPSSHASARLTTKLCGITVSLNASAVAEDGVVKVVVDEVLQPPNPCYQVVSSEGRVLGNNTILLRYVVVTPRPGTYCVQVLPPPSRGTYTASVKGGVNGVKVEVVDKTTGRVCEAWLPLSLRAPGSQ